MKMKKGLMWVVILCVLLTTFTYAEDEANDDVLDLNGSYAIAMDVETGEIIYAKNIDQKTFPASTTKIMTALIFAENKTKDDLLAYTENALNQPSYSLNKDYGPISLGYQMTGDMVMKSLLIYSANDVAAMVEDNLALDGIDLMGQINQRIKDLGLTNSNYLSPNGIHDDNHYTTAYDLAQMAIEAFSNPWIQEVLSMPEVTLQIQSGILPVKNSNQKLNNNGLIYAKTGYTPEAGRCLVAIYERDGRKIVAAVLNAEYNYEDLIVFEDMDKLMDYSFDQAERVSYLDQVKPDFTVDLTYKPLKTFGKTVTETMDLRYDGDFLYYPNALNQAEVEFTYDLYDIDVDQLDKSLPVGQMTFTQRNTSHTIDLYPAMDTEEIYDQHQDLYKQVKLYIIIGGVLAFLVLVLIFVFIRSKLRRNKRRY